jgi:Flagellar protein FliT
MNITVRQQLAGLLEIAECMQARAVDNDWDAVAQFRIQVQQRVEALCSGHVSRDLAPVLGDVIRRVSVLNNEVIALCRNERDARGHDLDKLKHRRRAINSYSVNSGS